MSLQGADLLVAQRGRVSVFSLDVSHACRGCYAEGTAVPDALVAEWEKDGENPPCEAGDWDADELFVFMPWCRLQRRDESTSVL